MEVTAAIATIDPAVEMYHSQHANGDTTVVMEVSGLDHLDVLKNAYVHELMFKELLQQMAEDLKLV